MKLIITDLENFNLSIKGEHKIIKPQGDIKHCIGCFGCWIKTPGKCVIHDGYENTGIDMGKCSELIIISKCYYGSVSPFVKMVQDRAISYIHPDFVIRKGEMHHKRRYKNVISVSAYFYGENITDVEKETARNILEANADNYDGQVKSVHFYKTIQELEGVIL
ncbi:MAG: flavodoxin family protein [Lachnospiraceae bacterium]|nr:flavodoxin family protein [Lachnospiraceae bacterium]